jgi:hypothetical protein
MVLKNEHHVFSKDEHHILSNVWYTFSNLNKNSYHIFTVYGAHLKKYTP